MNHKTMEDKNNIFNIEANHHFFESFFFWLENHFGQELSSAKIFLPNRRSCRELKQLFLQQGFGNKLPEIKAISDISFEDFFDFLPNKNVKNSIDELLQIKLFDDIDYLFFLSEKIQNQAPFGKVNFEQSFKIALHLKNLFDEIERSEIDLKKITDLDDSSLSKHRQITLEFLKDFCIHIKNSLLKENIFSLASYQNLIAQKFIQALEDHELKTPIIIAGSTGSVLFGKKLIKAISKKEKGFVILHGFEEKDFEEENHPQFYLNQLVNFLGVEKKSLKKISNPNFKISDEARQELLSLMMMPFYQTAEWQKISSHLDAKKTAADIEKNFFLIEAKNEIEEAKIISLVLLEKFYAKKKCAIISNDEILTQLLKLELQRLNLPFNDSRSLDIFNSKLINFLLLILEVFESDFNSHALLSLLKHPLCNYSQNLDLLAKFEIDILRKSRATSDLNGILEKLENEELKKFFTEFLAKLTQSNSIKSLIKNAEKLSKKTWHELLLEEPAQVEIFRLFEKLKSKNYSANSTDDFKTILAQISYFEHGNAFSMIQILSPIEARLLNFDCIIISSLNEGNFPKIESDNWLGKKIKKDLGIDNAVKKIGQNAHDFCHYLSNPEIVMTRCKQKNGALLIESPFLLKFKTICKKLEAKLNFGEKYFLQLEDLNRVTFREKIIANPKPKKELRPQKFSITEISKLLRDPYFIYCKKILQLRELEKIDYEAGYSEFGSFIHKALEEFIKNPQSVNFEEIFAQYFISDESKLIWWPKFENIFSDFLEKNKLFADLKNMVEKPVEFRIGKILVTGKIDRIIFNQENAAEIFDYKTGQVPARKDVACGIEPQLTLAALALLESVLQDQKISSLNYWKLSSSSEGEIKKVFKDEEEIQVLIAAAKSGLEELFTYFSDEKNGYLATGEVAHDEYWQLARIN